MEGGPRHHAGPSIAVPWRPWQSTSAAAGTHMRLRHHRGLVGHAHLRGGFKPSAHHVGGHRLAEEMTLTLVTSLRPRKNRLFFGLDALGHDDLVETCAETGHGGDDRTRLAFLAEIADEGLIDLDLVERKLSQVIERRVTRAEVVQRDADAEIFQLLHDGECGVALLQEDALGDLDLKPLSLE